jgi:hypothetical protein
VDHFVKTGPFERRKETAMIRGVFDPAKSPPDETERLICEARLGGDVIEMPLAEFEVDDHEEWEELSEWQGPCRPEKFDAEAATKEMRRGLPNWREVE